MQISDAAIGLHRTKVFRYLRRHTGSDELAEDLTQDVFASAAEHLGKLDGDRPLLAWLYRVARNRLVDELRRRDHHPRLVALTDDIARDAETDYGPSIGAAVRRASMSLEESDRELLGLRLFTGEPFAAIAHRLGVSEPAAKMRYLRALRRLRHALEQEGVDRD